MKKTLFILIMLTISIVSCNKQDTDNFTEIPECTSSIIYAEFDNNDQSKTKDWIHDGKTTPIFVVNDEIWISNGTSNAKGIVTNVNEDSHVAAITIQESIDLSGNVYAVYPYSAAHGINGGNIQFKIPTVQNGSFAQANISVAKRNPGETRLSFKNATSMFKVTAKPEVIKQFIFDKEGIAGIFEASFDGKNVQNVSTIDASNTITVDNIEGSGPYYIAIATGLSYEKDGHIANYINPNQVEAHRVVGFKNAAKDIGPFTRSKIYNIGDATLNYSLNGKFSVNDSKMVYFAKGNMYWNGSTYNFEANQWDINYEWDPNHVTHFYFCTDEANAYAKAYFDPWGSVTTINDILFTNETATTPNQNLVISGDKGLWRCLSIEEWKYLIGINGVGRILNGGTGRGYTFDFAMINGTDEFGSNGIFGVVIYDDGYKGTVQRHTIVTPSDPFGLTGVQGLTSIPENSVFIPGNGVRDGVNSDGTEWGMNICGFYWTSESAKVDGMVPANICAHTFDYSDNGNLYNTDSWYRAYASCIRPVADVQ